MADAAVRELPNNPDVAFLGLVEGNIIALARDEVPRYVTIPFGDWLNGVNSYTQINNLPR